jgi:hypothetical protein
MDGLFSDLHACLLHSPVGFSFVFLTRLFHGQSSLIFASADQKAPAFSYLRARNLEIKLNS